MKTVKKRTVSIIHELIGNEELMTLSELAEKFEVSQRTIRNDLKLINELLKEMDLGKIRLVGGRIICPSSFGQVLKAVPKDDLYTYKLSQEGSQMKTVKKRTVSIIHELIGNEELMTLSELAEKFEVSQRTIRNDLKLINELLKEMDLGKIRLVGGRIICPSSFGQVLKAVPKDDLYTYKLSQEERIEIAASFLINTVEYITMSVIADNLVVSRSTVINDLSKIKAYIGQGNLKVLSHPNKGLRVEGKESDKRLFLMNIKGNGVEKEQKDIVESIVLKQLNLRTDSWQKIREILYESVYLDQSRVGGDYLE